jgi:hypothetical protein
MSAIFLYKNLFDSAVSVTGTNTVAGYPVTNLNKRQLSSKWRCNSAGSKLTIDFGVAKSIRCIVLAGINAQGVASRSNDATFEFSTDGVTYSNASFTLPVDAGCASLPAFLVVFLASAVLRRYLRIGPSWIVGGGYWEIGRVLVGNVLEIPDGCENGWKESFYDPGTVDLSAGNQAYGDPRPTGRMVTIPFPNGVPNSVARGFDPDASAAGDVPSFQDMFLSIGSTREVFASLTTASPLWLRRVGIYGRLTADSLGIEKLEGDNHAVTVTVIEER